MRTVLEDLAYFPSPFKSENHDVPLQALSAAVKVDKEEWVGVIGRAVGGFDGQLDLAAVMKGSSAVSLPQLPCLWHSDSLPRIH